MPKLTKRTVDALRPRADGIDLVLFDDELPGFGVRVKPSGAKSWLIQYRNAHGRSRRFTLARFSVLTPEKARREAKLRLAEVAKGADPAADRRTARGAITVGELCDEYLEAGKGRIKNSTLLMDGSRIERHVKPLLGTRAVASLTPADLERFLRDVRAGKTAPKRAETPKGGKRPLGGQTTGGPGVASRTLGMLGTILQRAVRDGVLASNPARGIARPKDQPKKPPFSFEAVAGLGAALRAREAEGENIAGGRAIRFLLLTGLRRMEALTLTWGMVDRRARCIRFEDTKSGPQTRPLGRAALELLASFEPKDTKPGDYVFPGAESGKHLIGLPKVWARVAKCAELGGVSLHGLRHWFASAAAEMNFSELTIAGLLGHRVKGVTARYATAPDSALLSAADRVSLRLSDALDGVEGAKVISLTA
jgi:site-specific recombinase XerD